MSLFGRNHKKQSEKDTQEPSSKAKRAPRSTGHLHTRRKKKTLLEQMKVQASVPATVIDAIHGDSSVINSDKDFIRTPKLTFSDGDYYPVLILDNDSLEDAGLGDHDNKSILGEISAGLKTSSGASGFVPVATTESLAQGYLALLPMHDAIEILREYSVINDYKKGWPVGLLRIDNDDLVLTKTNLRLTLAEWWQFIKKKLDFVVDHDQLKKSTDVPANSDPLAVDSQEEAGGADLPHVAQSVALPTGEFDDDDGPSSNSNIDNFVNSQSGDSGNSQDGFAIPGISASDDNQGNLAQSTQNNSSDQTQNDNQAGDDSDDGLSLDDLDIPSPTSSDVADVSNQVGRDNQDNRASSVAPVATDNSNSYLNMENNQAGNGQPDSQPQTNQGETNNNAGQSMQGQIVNQPSQGGNPSQYVVAKNRDELDAQNAILSSSVRTLNDLSVSISDDEFIKAYLRPLNVEHIPLLDESNDPTGYRHHQNALRRQANVELDGALQDEQAGLRSWFEVQRSSILSVLQQKTTRDGSEVNHQRSVVHDLEAQLADENGLREAAQIDVQDQLDDLDRQFEDAHKTARQAAIAEVDSQFNDRRRQLQQQKNDIINAATASRREGLSKQMGSAKAKIRDLAETAASASYQDVMTQGAEQYHAAQQRLARHRQLVLDKIDADEKAARRAENQRAENDAAVARQSTEVQQLKAQLRDMQERNEQALKEAKDNAKVQIQSVQANADQAQQNAVASVQRDLKSVMAERDNLKNELEKERQHADDRFDAQEDKYGKQLDALQNKLDRAQQDTDRSNRHTVRNAVAASIVGMAIFGGAGWLGGELHATKTQNQIQTSKQTNDNNNNDSSRSNQPMIIQVPGNNSGNSNSSDKSSNSHSDSQSNDSESHSTSTNSSSTNSNAAK